jgi:putative oxidoreductase
MNPAQLLLGTSQGVLATSAAVLILRLFVGAAFVVHGAPKLFGAGRGDMRKAMSQLLGIPGALFDLTALLEFLGGIMLVIGLLTRLVAALFVIEMMMTTISYITKLYNAPLPRGWTEQFFKATRGYMFGWEFDSVLLAASAAIAILGPGLFSIDRIILAVVA